MERGNERLGIGGGGREKEGGRPERGRRGEGLGKIVLNMKESGAISARYQGKLL
jgi:hypothetical protein